VVSLFVIFFIRTEYIAGQRCIATPVRIFVPPSQTATDSLNTLYGQNKKFIEQYKSQCLLALSFYPELHDVEINFLLSKESTTMACRPDIGSLLKNKRTYNIFINNKSDFEGILLPDVPFNAQVGVIGHEIAHIVDYENRNLLGVIQVGIDYLNMERKQVCENYIDMLTIEKGLGWQLYDWAQYSMYDSPKATDKYKEFKRNIYLNPAQIEERMKVYSCYNHFFRCTNPNE
jgi:hypothetical protein